MTALNYIIHVIVFVIIIEIIYTIFVKSNQKELSKIRKKHKTESKLRDLKLMSFSITIGIFILYLFLYLTMIFLEVSWLFILKGIGLAVLYAITLIVIAFISGSLIYTFSELNIKYGKYLINNKNQNKRNRK